MPHKSSDNQPEDLVDNGEYDPDNTPMKEVKARLRGALQEVRSGQMIPLVWLLPRQLRHRYVCGNIVSDRTSAVGQPDLRSCQPCLAKLF